MTMRLKHSEVLEHLYENHFISPSTSFDQEFSKAFHFMHNTRSFCNHAHMRARKDTRMDTHRRTDADTSFSIITEVETHYMGLIR